MKKNLFPAAGLLVALLLTSIPVVRADQKNLRDSGVAVTPPAPKFTDAERQSELERRRQAVVDKMSPNSVLILWSAQPRNYAGDVDFMYRQENNLYYLTNLRQKGSTLVLIKDGDNKKREMLFLPKRDPATETWNGKMYSEQDATTISGIKTVNDAAELKAVLESIKNKTMSSFKADKVYLLLPESEQDGDGLAEFRRESDFAKTLGDAPVENARLIFDELRLTKSPMELKLLQHAIDITTEAQLRAMATAKNVKWEYETQAEIEYIFRKRNADYWGYPSIVGCGPNATTLHYEESQGGVKTGDLLLMDVGAEYDHYTADVTRTFPINGKFSKEQAEIYQIVYDAQEAAAKTLKPGSTVSEAGRAAATVLKNGLAKLGLITAPDATFEMTYNGKTYARPQYTLWYMHGWGHWLGMNVHDVGEYSTPLKAGMVMTNEPGIYIREDALNYLPDTPENKAFIAKIRPMFEKYKNIGVRIEDDMLVTDTVAVWMTKNLPRSMADIEAFMSKNSITVAETKTVKPDFKIDYQYFLQNGNLQTVDNFFIGESQPLSGKRGWIYSGKQTADAGLAHAE